MREYAERVIEFHEQRRGSDDAGIGGRAKNPVEELAEGAFREKVAGVQASLFDEGAGFDDLADAQKLVGERNAAEQERVDRIVGNALSSEAAIQRAQNGQTVFDVETLEEVREFRDDGPAPAPKQQAWGPQVKPRSLSGKPAGFHDHEWREYLKNVKKYLEPLMDRLVGPVAETGGSRPAGELARQADPCAWPVLADGSAVHKGSHSDHDSRLQLEGNAASRGDPRPPDPVHGPGMAFPATRRGHGRMAEAIPDQGPLPRTGLLDEGRQAHRERLRGSHCRSVQGVGRRGEKAGSGYRERSDGSGSTSLHQDRRPDRRRPSQHEARGTATC